MSPRDDSARHLPAPPPFRSKIINSRRASRRSVAVEAPLTPLPPCSAAFRPLPRLFAATPRYHQERHCRVVLPAHAAFTIVAAAGGVSAQRPEPPSNRFITPAFAATWFTTFLSAYQHIQSTPARHIALQVDIYVAILSFHARIYVFVPLCHMRPPPHYATDSIPRAPSRRSP